MTSSPISNAMSAMSSNALQEYEADDLSDWEKIGESSNEVIKYMKEKIDTLQTEFEAEKQARKNTEELVFKTRDRVSAVINYETLRLSYQQKVIFRVQLIHFSFISSLKDKIIS